MDAWKLTTYLPLYPKTTILGGLLVISGWLLLGQLSYYWFGVPLILLMGALASILLGQFWGFGWLLVGVLISFAATQAIHSCALPETAKPVWLKGQIIRLVSKTLGYSQIRLTALKLAGKKSWQPACGLVQLKIATDHMRRGDRLHVKTRLRRPHSLSNPGGRDRQRYFFSHNIQGIGVGQSSVISHRHVRSDLIAMIGLSLEKTIKHAFTSTTIQALLIALTIGDTSGLTAEHWQILQKTGTSHLVAISGLHIGACALWMYWLGKWFWTRFPKAPLRLAAPKFAAVWALLIACFYAALAGFSTPTVRSLIMLLCFMGGYFVPKPIPLIHRFAAALFLVLLIQPLSVLTTSFWLSFGCVVTILMTVSAMRTQAAGIKGLWMLNKKLFIGMLPLGMLFFQSSALNAPLVNMIAVPLMSFVVLPVVMVAMACSVIPIIGSAVFSVAAIPLKLLWSILQAFSVVAAPMLSSQVLEPWVFFSISIGALVWLMPQGFPARKLALLGALPLLFPSVSTVAYKHALISVLDVGQGLAVVVQTAKHTLIYDTGPSYWHGGDAAQRVMIPFLNHQGVRAVDTIIVSHADDDHKGGLESLLKRYYKAQLITSFERYEPHWQNCIAPQKWQWDGVNFLLLSGDHDQALHRNDRSCVLQITVDNHAILLTGDIEQLAEKRLVDHYGKKLQSSVLVVPHHGSKTSSTTLFLDTVKPQYAIISSGYRNRYHLPHPKIIARYQHKKVKVYNTANSGAVQILIKPKGAIALSEYNKQFVRRW